MMNNDSMNDQGIPETVLHFPGSRKDILSFEASNIFRVVNNVVLSSLVGLFGLAANVINMIIFYRQGFNTTTNISFFAMAISDMGCIVTVLWCNICLNPYLGRADITFVPEEILYLTGSWFHVCCSRITSWITVFVTAERLLGIALPLKVKQIITLRRTTITMCLVFLINLSLLLPDYIITYWDWRFVPAKNRTLYGLMYRSYKDKLYGLTYTLTSVSGFVSFSFVFLLTCLLVTKLERKSKWRNQATGKSDTPEVVSTRDKKTVKMIITIACVLIVCYLPGTALCLVPAFLPQFNIGEEFINSCYACWSVAYLFSTINSSVNVFLYYTMSTKYRHTFNELFSSCSKTAAS